MMPQGSQTREAAEVSGDGTVSRPPRRVGQRPTPGRKVPENATPQPNLPPSILFDQGIGPPPPRGSVSFPEGAMAARPQTHEGPFAARLAPVRAWLALSRALHGFESGLLAGAALALLLALLHWTGAAAAWPRIPATPRTALTAAALLAFGGALLALLTHRASPHRVAALVDERLGLAERTATALALRAGAAADTPLAPLVEEDARRAPDTA